MQIPEARRVGRLSHGVVSCFWKQGEPRWLQEATEGLEQQRTDVR